VKSAATFLSGIAAWLTGASIRSCQPDIPSELANAWCGPAVANPFAAATHAHCAGCVMMFVGVALVGVAFAWLVARTVRRIRA